MTTVLQRVADFLSLDPFAYLMATILGVAVWSWVTVVSSNVITGRGTWLRWGLLAVAGFCAIMFAYTARLMT